jgi:hypothetical protein
MTPSEAIHSVRCVDGSIDHEWRRGDNTHIGYHISQCSVCGVWYATTDSPGKDDCYTAATMEEALALVDAHNVVEG